MEAVLEFLKEIAKNWDMIVANFGEFKVAIAAIVASFFVLMGSITTALGIIYSICLIIPGEKPDVWVKKVLDFTTKYSKK